MKKIPLWRVSQLYSLAQITGMIKNRAKSLGSSRHRLEKDLKRSRK
jgi:hypothetical protein